MTQMNLSTKEKQIHRHRKNRLVVADRVGEGRGTEWEFGVSKCKLLHLEWIINNEVLLYSTGNYIQCPVINHDGKEYEKGYIYV